MTKRTIPPGPAWTCPQCKRQWGHAFFRCAYCGVTLNAFQVFLDGKHIDTVFSTETDAEVMRQQLINHDGFDPRITVTMKGA